MTRALASAAPARLRQAAKAGAGRLANTCRRQYREQTRALEEWQCAARQWGWVSSQPALRKGPVFGTTLDRYCGSDTPRTAKNPASRAAKSAVRTEPSPPRRTPPGYLKPQKAAVTPATEFFCALNKTASAKIGRRRLRRWAGSNIPEEPAAPPDNRPQFAKSVKSRVTNPVPVPETGNQPEWSANLAMRAATRFTAEMLVTDASPGFQTAFARPLVGQKAPHSLLERSAVARPSGEAVSAPGSAANHRKLQKHATPARTSEKLRHRDPVSSDPVGRPRAIEPAPKGKDSGKKREWLPHTLAVGTADFAPSAATGRHHPDPLDSDTINPPRHSSPVQLPPQPDLVSPFAEIVPLERRASLVRAQGAVADGALPEPSPPPDCAPLRPRFDRNDLGEALAEVLRDEARRHGIDV